MAQDPLTLRQAIDEALRQSPQAAIAHADLSDTKAAAAMARTQLLPQLNFTEDHGCPGKNEESYSKRLIIWPIDLDRVGNDLKLKCGAGGAWLRGPRGATMRNERWPDRVFSVDRAFAP